MKLSPMIWKGKEGEDKETQIEDGDLFDFDKEVEPILNVLTSKILEISTMEVLEEEEIKFMHKQQNYYKLLKKQENEFTQKLEAEEDSAFETKKKKKEEAIKKKELLIKCQKKLMVRVNAKEYLRNLKINTLTKLSQYGLFRKPEATQYFSKFHPLMMEKTQDLSKTDFKLVQTFDSKNNFM